MNKIRILPQNLINLIAAGEVVERPSSVLKELLENSIDAESSKIIVNIKDYGNELIEVKDNGVGMDQENAKMAFKQHATSKINNEEDLHKILSFGFRGEALASISSVAERVELQSKIENGEAVKLTIENTKEDFAKSTQTEKGTKISIYNIFKNIPARKKFLKSNAVELKHLTETFLNIALPHLNIHFELYHNDRLVYRLTKAESFKNRVFEAFGKQTASNLFEMKTFDNGQIKITGYFGKPEIGKKSYNFQYTYVNRRFVINKIVATAVLEAYKGFIHKDLKPAYFLFIEIDPSQIDVNIHPRKTEIRFLNSQEIFRYVYSLCRKTLETSTKSIITDTLQDNFDSENRQDSASNDFFGHTTQKPSFLANDKTSNYSFKQKAPKGKVQEALSFTKNLIDSSKSQNFQEFLNSDSEEKKALYNDKNEAIIQGSDSQITQQEMKYDKVFQLFNTYILFEKDNKLIMLDQHASAEKILFERLYLNLGELKTKPLLIPEILELKRHDKELLLEKKEELKNIGIILEDFGQDSIQILEIPEAVENIDIQDYIDEVLNMNTDLEKTYESEKDIYPKLNKEVYMLLATTACHGSIRAGQKLEREEMVSIIKNLLTLKNPYNCPHGRPTIWQLERSEIEKNFKRRF